MKFICCSTSQVNAALAALILILILKPVMSYALILSSTVSFLLSMQQSPMSSYDGAISKDDLFLYRIAKNVDKTF